MRDLKLLVSYLLPFFSLVIIVAFMFATNNNTTGLVILDQNMTTKIDADVTLQLFKDEIIPVGSVVEVLIDDRKTSIAISDFIDKSGGEKEVMYGSLSKANYAGYGYSGNVSYKLPLSELDIDRSVLPGAHTLKTRILFNNQVLFENVKDVHIS